MRKINIDIQPEVFGLLAKGRATLCQVYGLPDSGVSVSMFALLNRLLDDRTFALYIASRDNVLSSEVAREIAGESSRNIIMAVIDYSDADKLFGLIDSYTGLADYVFIDDFARIVLNRKRSYINYVLQNLKNKSREARAPFVIMNQLRFQIRPGMPEAEKFSRLKPLYSNYLEPFIDANLVTVKEGTSILLKTNPVLVRAAAPADFIDALIEALEEAGETVYGDLVT